MPFLDVLRIFLHVSTNNFPALHARTRKGVQFVALSHPTLSGTPVSLSPTLGATPKILSAPPNELLSQPIF